MRSTLSREELEARPLLMAVHLAYGEAMMAMPADAMAWMGTWLGRRGYQSPAQATDRELIELRTALQVWHAEEMAHRRRQGRPL